jgi:tetratricopeptide (TPR) repeat protein
MTDTAALIETADRLYAARDWAAALDHYQRALALLEKALGATNPALIEPLVGIGKAQVALGKPRLAAAQLDRALGLANAETDPVEIATGRFAIAQVLAGIDAARARTLATQAHDAFAAAGPDHAREAETAAHWLAAHE